MKHPLRKTPFVALVFLLLGACGTGGDTGGGSGAATSDAGGTTPFADSGIVFDSAPGASDVPQRADAVAPGDTATARDSGAALDSGARADAPDPCGFPDSPGFGEVGSVCKGNEDCDSGWCVQTIAGKRCTRACVECCPGGWKCEQAPGSDTTYICVPKMGALCLPCRDDSECDKVAKGALCVAFAAETELAGVSFCGGACTSNDDCPAGFSCHDRKGTKGASKQCVRDQGICPCTAVATATGAIAACTLTNPHGTCSGTRKCEAGGLTACTAPAATPETCDGEDNDCDGETDEGIVGVACSKKNAHGTCKGISTCVGSVPGCDAPEPAAERCDGVDNDCDGSTDEGCDADGDGYCGPGVEIAGLPAACTGDLAACNQSAELPPWCPKGIGDCDDDPSSGGKEIHPGAVEKCDDKLDNDCDGDTDRPGSGTAEPAGCKLFYADQDNDGFGAGQGACLCAPTPGFNSSLNTDCDDKDSKISPAAKEICGNGIDDNCNHDQNEDGALNCKDWWADQDGDGFGAGVPKCLCAPKGKFKVEAAGDCDDGTEKVNPKAVEACNGVDDDCNSSTDEQGAAGCKKWYVDGDQDGYGDSAKAACLCAKTAPYTTLQGGDCADDKPNQHPGFQELCHDGVDNDCDGKTDEENGKLCLAIWLDEDGDGWGRIGSKKCLCDKDPKTGYTAVRGKDCNDNPATGKQVHPDAEEICDGIDNDCASGADAGCDLDGDGWCTTGKKVIGKPKSCPMGGGDCNDDPKAGGKAVHPGAKEICNGRDDDCKGGTDEGCDDDGDGWCDQKMVTVGRPAVCKHGGGDCNDKDSNVRPGRGEICNNIDDNCKAGADEGCDDDHDGWCDQKMPVVGFPKVCKHGGGDCCDTDAAVKPKTPYWYTTKDKCGSWDYNCSGGAEKRYTVRAAPYHICEGFACMKRAECIAKPRGWAGSPPACGVSATWIYDYDWDGSLTLPLVNTCKIGKTKSWTQSCH